MALEIVDYFDLDLDIVDDLSNALYIYKELYSDCYNKRKKITEKEFKALSKKMYKNRRNYI